ncbi:MAG TPA: polysaccharide deacetylase family protein [Pseudomonadales bacterium]|nr:polysaccharide deacetylase family protein [Pseudomonadales bacterium]
MRRALLSFVSLVVASISQFSLANPSSVPILCYHRFGPTVADSMTIRTETFVSQLDYLKDNGYTVVPLADALAWREGKKELPDKSVVITVDDGHISQYTVMKPIIEKYKIPVTLFIYPSAISNASYAMTWDQVREMRNEQWFNVQGHTYWHPNFKTEKKRLKPDEYEKFVNMQLGKSKSVLEKKLDISVDTLAWPFGIETKELQEYAAHNGYQAALALEGRTANQTDSLYALPRFLMSEQYKGHAFVALLNSR